MAARKVLRVPKVLECTGWSRSTLYQKIKDGRFPSGQKLDPNGHTRVWFEDEIEAYQSGTWKPAAEVAA
jgi:predicted DNA-binding transcriptional regulator AlpA